MNRQAALLACVAFVGAAILLSQIRWFRRASLATRLESYSPASATIARTLVSAESFRDVIGPLCRTVGDHLAGVVGVNEDLSRRLERLHLPVEPTAFRMREAAWAGLGLGIGLLCAMGLGIVGPVALLPILGTPALAFLICEQRLANRSSRRQEQLRVELPVMTEQLAMLLGAGFSLGAALNRLAHRGRGVAARDLIRVVRRIRQGLDEHQALREWAEIADIASLHRLVRVLALDHQATDLGRLVAAEAASMRREHHRRVVESIERRAQQVWIPVTVAALLPGAIFLAVPFIDALELITGG